MKDKVKKEEGEDFILKKIRYYQGTIDDFQSYWDKRTAEGERELSPETRSIKPKNDALNKAFEIVPVSPNDNDSENEVNANIEEVPSEIDKKTKEHKKENEDGKDVKVEKEVNKQQKEKKEVEVDDKKKKDEK